MQNNCQGAYGYGTYCGDACLQCTQQGCSCTSCQPQSGGAGAQAVCGPLA